MLYDVIIVGCGPAGLSAGLYAGRYKLKTLIIGKKLGGLAADAHRVCNYPGVKEISGVELAKKMKEQVDDLGVEIINVAVDCIEKSGKDFRVKTKDKEYGAQALILALGRKRRKLNIPGEKQFLGRGVSYCATCDAPLFQDKIVAVIGGSDSACHSAILLSQYTRKIYLIYRKDRLRAEPHRISEVESEPKIEIIYKTNPKEIKGSTIVERVILDKPHKGSKELKVDGIFVEIGTIPETRACKGLGVNLDENGNITIDEDMKTNVDRVYAVGDVTGGLGGLKQIVTSAAQGAVAATQVFRVIRREKLPG